VEVPRNSVGGVFGVVGRDERSLSLGFGILDEPSNEETEPLETRLSGIYIHWLAQGGRQWILIRKSVRMAPMF
jgi:hypothetical protein